MSDVNRLKAKIKEYFCKVINESEEGFMSKEEKNVLTYNKDIQKMIDEELAKEPQECKWIPCSERLPEEPKENPVFDNKPLELYLVSEKDADYPFRAFWNGKTFTDGFGKLNVIAWQPLPSAWK